MPRHRKVDNNGLRFMVLGGDESLVFTPGQAFGGLLQLVNPADGKYTLIDIRLQGRTKVKLVEHRPPLTGRAYRSEIMLLDGSTAWVRTSGNINSADDDFAINVDGSEGPEGPNGPANASWEWWHRFPFLCRPIATWPRLENRDLFLRLGRRNLVRPPASFYHQSSTAFMSMTCYVEYYLEALMLDRRGKHYMAFLPIKVGHMRKGLTADDLYRPKRCKLSGSAISHGLIKGIPDTRPALRHSLGQAFETEAIPQFAYQMYVDVPSALQPGNVNHVPITIWPSSEPNRCSELLQHSYQTFHVEEFQLSIRETVRMVADGKDGPRRCKTSRMVNFWGYKQPSGAPEDGSKSIKFLCPGPAFTLGQVMNILVPASVDVHPSFKTYNIKVTHQLCWKLTLSVVGVKQTFSHRSPVKIEGPPALATIRGHPRRSALERSHRWVLSMVDGTEVHDDDYDDEEEEEEECPCACF